AVLDRLKRKYGPTVAEVIKFGDGVAAKLDQIENREQALKDLHQQLAAASAEYLTQARTLSKKRFETARKLERIVESEINALAMKAKFKIEIAGTDDEQHWTAHGFDTVVYMIATNPGEPMQPIE